MKNVFVTTSWDDGHVLDIKLADLLRKYSIAATFYISPENRELVPEVRLSKEEVQALAKDFEIGAHTMTHPRLSQIDDQTAHKEIFDSKKTLEEWLSHNIKSFCYPGGDYQEKHKQMVKDAGFSMARTVGRFATEIGNDPFAVPTTIHGYRHWSDAVPIFREAGPSLFINHYLNWDELAIAYFEKVLANGGVFHLWGHSWEIEKNGDWDRLEEVLKHIAHRPGVQYSINGDLVS